MVSKQNENTKTGIDGPCEMCTFDWVNLSKELKRRTKHVKGNKALKSRFEIIKVNQIL